MNHEQNLLSTRRKASNFIFSIPPTLLKEPLVLVPFFSLLIVADRFQLIVTRLPTSTTTIKGGSRHIAKPCTAHLTLLHSTIAELWNKVMHCIELHSTHYGHSIYYNLVIVAQATSVTTAKCIRLQAVPNSRPYAYIMWCLYAVRSM